MAPKMTPFPLTTTVIAVAKATATAVPRRGHNLKMIAAATTLIAILLMKSQQTLAQDIDTTSALLLQQQYNDYENSIYHNEENGINRIFDGSSLGTTAISTGSDNIQVPEVFSCPGEGLYAHNYECQLYYRCEIQTNGHIKAYLLSCKKGTIFSRDLNLCMPAILANREECQQYINEIDALTSNRDDDIDGIVGAGVGGGGHFGDVINSAIDDDSIDSRLKHVLNAVQVKGGIANNGNAMDATYNHWQNYGLTGLSGVSVISFSTSSARSAGFGSGSSSADNDQGPPCEDDGFMSDPDDCTVFYRCISNGRTFNKIGFRCSDGTAWDESLQSCNHILNVRANGGCQGKQGIQMDDSIKEQSSTQSSQSSHQNSTSSSTMTSESTSSSHQSSMSSSSSSSNSTMSSTASSSHQSNSQSSSTETSSSSSSSTQSSSSSSNSSSQQSSTSSNNQENSSNQNSNSNSNSGSNSQSSESNNSNSQNNNSNQSSNNQNSGNNHNSNNQQSSSNSNSQNSNANTETSNANTQNSGSNSQNSTSQNSNSNSNNEQTSNSQNSNSNAQNNQNSSNESNQQSSNSENSSSNQSSNSQSSGNQEANQSSSSSSSQNNNQEQNSSNNHQESTASSNSHTSDTNNNQQQGSTNSNSQSNEPTASDCVDDNTYLEDKKDCAKFYRCRDNGNGGLEIVPFTCGPGTVWNQDDKVCDLPTDSQREKCKSLASSSGSNNQAGSSNNQSTSTSNQSGNESSQASNNNNQAGSSTANNQSSSSNSQTGASSSNNQSESSSNANQSSSSNGQSSSTSNNNHQNNQSNQSSNNQSSGSAISNGQEQTKPQKPSNPDGECKDSETYLQDKYDCARFYRCVDNGNGGFDRISFDCAPGTVWDPNSKSCNHPTDVQKEQCRVMAGNGSSSSQNHESSSNSQNQESGSPTSSSNNSNQNQGSNNQGSSSSSSSNNNQSSSNSQSESQQESSSANQNQGSSNQSSNNQTSTSSNNNNQNSSSNQSSSNNQGSNTSSSSANNNSNNQSSSSQSESSNQSSTNNQSSNTSSSSSSNTSNQSSQSESSNQSSSNNQNSSSSSSSSNNNSNSESSSSQSESSSNNQGSNSSSSSSSNNNNESSNSQSGSNNQGTSSTSNNNQSSNSSQSGSSSQQSGSQSSGSVSSQQNPVGICKENNQYLEDAKDCSKFYRCVKSGKDSFDKVSFTCGPGTIWDSEIKGCNHAWAVKNKKCGAGSSSGSTTQKPTHQTTLKPSTQRPPTSTQNPSKPTHKPSTGGLTTTKPPAQGVCKVEGFTGDPNDCSRFYRCVDNGNGGFMQYSFRCGQGTVWDSELQTCNHDLNKCNLNTGEQSVTQKPNGVTTTGPGYLPPQSTTTTSRPGFQPTTTVQSETTNGKPGYQPTTTQMPQETTTTNKPGYQPTTQKPQEMTTTKPEYQPTTDSGKNPETTSQSTITTIKPDPNEPIAASNKCPKEGFFGDKEDCKKFYRCIDNGKGGFEKHSFKCGNNTVWDAKIESCNHPEQVSDPRCHIETTTASYVTTTTSKYESTTVTANPTPMTTESMPTGELTTTMQPSSTTPIPNLPPGTKCQGEGFMADPNNCQKFYRCTKSEGGYKKHEFKCAKSTAWNEKTQSCDHRNNVERCQNQTEEPEPETTTVEYQSTTTTEKYTSTTEISTTETIEKPSTTIKPATTTTFKPTTTHPTSTTPVPNLPPGTKCQGEGFMADPDNCRKFYRCEKNENGYSQHEFMCAKGTGWNDKKQTCDHRDNIERCQGQTEEPDLETTTLEYTISTTETQTTTSGFEKPSTTTVAYETTPTIAQKPTTTFIPTTSESTTTVDFTTTMQPTSTTPIPNLTPGKNCNGEGFMADPDNCRKFYRCQKSGNGYTKHEFMCAKGTGWNEENQTCDHRENIERCQGQTEEPEPETTTVEYTTEKPTSTTEAYKPISTTSSYENTTAPYRPTTTASYPTTTSQPIKPTTTKTPNTSTDYTTTMQPTSTTPIPNLPPGKNCNGEGFMADPNNCRIFYRCEKTGNGYSKHEFMCAKGTGWSEEKQVCDYRDNVENCQGQTEQPDPETTTIEYITSSPTDTTPTGNEKPSTTSATTSFETTTITNGKPTTSSTYPTTTEPSNTTEYTTTMQTTSTTPIPNLPPGKSCNGEGFMADPDNCRKFYRCEKSGNSFSKYEFMCAKGTGWSEEKQTCDHRDNIDRCQGQTEEPDPETTTMEYTTISSVATTTSGYEKPTTTSTSTTYETTTKPSTSSTYPTTTFEPTKPTTTDPNTSTEHTSTMKPTSTTPIPNLSPGKNCNGEGYMADPDNCRKFYRCEKSGNGYSKHEFLCGKGTGWSEEKQACDHRDNVDRCQGQTEKPDEETTTMEYTTIKPTTMTPSTTIENEKPSSTTTTSIASTTQIPTTTPLPTTKPTTESSTNTTDFPSTSTDNYPTTMQPTSTTPIPNLPAGKKCQGEGFMADPDNCRKFYRCSMNGDKLEQHEFTCGKGTGWSEDKQTCDHASNVERCKGQIETTTSGYETTTTTLPVDSTTTAVQTTNKPGYVPTTTDSAVATTENPNTSTSEISTAATTTTSTELSTTSMQTTDKPGYVPTTTELSTTTEATTTDKPGYVPTTTEPTEASTSTTATTEEYESTTLEPINHNCTEEGFFADTNDCNRYYRCVDADKNGNYQVYSFRCPNGTVWDTSLDTCNYADKVSGNCSSGATTTEYPSTTEPTTTTGKPITTTTENPKETSTTEKMETTTTDNPTETTTMETTTTSMPQTTTTEHPKETTTEIIESTTTDKPQETTTEKPLETTTEITTIEPITGQTTSQPEPASNSSAPCPTTGEGQSLYICPTGFRRHPKNCNMFYQCTEKADSYDQSIVVFECPKDTVFHEDLNRCDAPKSNENCDINPRTQNAVYEEEYKRSHMIQIRSTAALCPSEGHFSLNNDECAQLFVKCQFSAQTLRLEGQIFRCPKGFTYWSVSRRCERTQKLQNCSATKYDVSTSIPVEWANIGNRRRNLRL